MAHSNWNENVMRIEIKLCEIFQNDVSLKREPFPETSQGNENLQTQLNIVPKVIRRMWIKDFMFYMLKDYLGNLMVKMHYGLLCYQWQYTSRWQGTSKWCTTCYVTKSRSLLLQEPNF